MWLVEIGENQNGAQADGEWLGQEINKNNDVENEDKMSRGWREYSRIAWGFYYLTTSWFCFEGCAENDWN